jgi:2-polyprenyl-6-methoxyphenol hydroxylase-like FAD-dependent oxidoreductase
MGDSSQIEQTSCCIVGGGPAGSLLALLLVRQGIPVTLLEADTTFDRDFRGNTLSPSAMAILAELGLAERVLALPHVKVPAFTLRMGREQIRFADFTRLKTPYPYVTMLPQVHLLELLTAEASRYPWFRLVMGASLRSLIDENGVTCGARYRGQDGCHELRAALTVGADGRHSAARRLAALSSISTVPPLDVLWFYLPRRPEDPDASGAIFRLGPGGLLVMMEHVAGWQVGYLIPKGSYRRVRAAGLAALREAVKDLAPEVAGRIATLQSWHQIALLSVESNRLRRWYRPGLLLIGDAAHGMSPLGGVGINCAMHDAVVAATMLEGPLRSGQVSVDALAAVQRRREWPTRILQGAQALLHRRLMAYMQDPAGPCSVPSSLRVVLGLPFLSDLAGGILAFDPWSAHVRAPTMCPGPDLPLCGV